MDEDAANRLRPVVAKDPAQARAALAELAHIRYRFDFDRAYRLLDAALTGNPVQSISEDKRDLFFREETLGRMPLADAFTYLVSMEPRLKGLANGDSTTTARLPEVLLDREEHDSFLESELTRALCMQYLAIVDGSSSGDVSSSSSFFELPRKKVIFSSRFHAV
jgi:hypothetical protein